MKRLKLSWLSIILIFAVSVGLAYRRGRKDVWITEYKHFQAYMTHLSQYETNHPPELREFVKAQYDFHANELPRSLNIQPRDYGPVCTNLAHLTSFKGPSNAEEEYREFIKRFSPQ